MKKLLLFLTVSLVFGNFLYTGEELLIPHHTKSIVVKPKPGAEQRLTEIAESQGGKFYQIGPYMDLSVLEFDTPADLELLMQAKREGNRAMFAHQMSIASRRVNQMLTVVEQEDLVVYAQPNWAHRIAYVPNDPYCITSSAMSPDDPPQQFGQFYMNIIEAWDHTMGSPDVLIAVLDSGVDVDHPELAGSIYINPGEDIDGDGVLYDLDDMDGIDNDGNGYVDDLFGYDFSGGNIGDEALDDLNDDDFNPDIHHWGDDGWGEPDPSAGDGEGGGMMMPADAGVYHGTHVAGIIAATADNEYLFAGAAPHCKILPVRIGHADGSMYSSDIVDGIQYAVATGAQVINMSLGGFGTDVATEEACEWAYDLGTAVAAATGNFGSFMPISSPASSEFTLAVGSCTSEDAVSSFTQTGPEMDIVTTGGESSMWTGVTTETIWSTMVYGVQQAIDAPGHYAGEHSYKGEVGTSMACPYAAALLGLIYSLDPDITPEEAFEVCRSTARDIGSSGFDEETGYGVADFEAAVLSLIEGPTIMPHQPIAGAISSNPDQIISFRYQSETDPALFSIDIDGTEYTHESPEVTIDHDEMTITVATSDLFEGPIDVEVTGFTDDDGIPAHSLPAFSFTGDYHEPVLFAPSPSTGATLRSIPEYFMFLMEDYSGIDPVNITVEDESGIYSTDDGVYVWGSMVYVPGSILEIPEEGELNLTLTLQDNVTLGEPNVAVIEVTYETALEGIMEKNPTDIAISDIYPNPFNSAANIDVKLARGGEVKIDIVDIKGRITRSMTRALPPGRNSIAINGENMPTGIYTAVISQDGKKDSRKLILLK